MYSLFVAKLVNERKAAGMHSVTLDVGELTSGIYLYRLEADGSMRIGIMTLSERCHNWPFDERSIFGGLVVLSEKHVIICIIGF